MKKLLTICVIIVTVCFFATSAHAIAIWGTGQIQLFDDDGDVLAGGKIYTYEPGSGVSKQTYSEYSGQTANTNPIILDSAGRATVYLDGSYKIVVHDSDDNTVWTLDNVAGEGHNVVTSVSTGVSGTFVLFGPSGTSTFNYLDKISGVSIVDELTLSSVTADVIRSGTSLVVDNSGTSVLSSQFNSVIVHTNSTVGQYGLHPISGTTSVWFKVIEGYSLAASDAGITIYSGDRDQPFHGVLYDNAILSGGTSIWLPPGNAWKYVTLRSVTVSGTCKYWHVEGTDSWVGN